MTNTNTYKGIYAMHKYWGKKPFNEISTFIERYSQPGEVVMDCFCGSGVTLIEALKADRDAIGIDLNPIAIKLTRASVTPVEIKLIEDKFKDIKNKLKKTIMSLYEVEYKGENTVVTHTIWKNEKPIEVWYSTKDKRKNIRTGNDLDATMCNFPSLMPKWYPDVTMFENSRINVGKDQRVADLFTPRALVGLSLLYDEIQKIDNENLKTIFELTFSGTLSQASNLVFVIRGRNKNKDNQDSITKAEVGSWVIGYWIPEEHFEINVWNCFENRYKRILRGEKEVFDLFSSRGTDYIDNHLTLINESATRIPFPDNSVDYVFIDPPHTNRIMYMEQSLMWNAWLRLDQNIDWEAEIVVSEAKERKDKNKENYTQLLNKVFEEIARVLRTDRYLSMAFNCLDDQTWIDTLNLFVAHGFEIVDIRPLEYSATSVIQDNRKNALKTDFVLTFQNTHNNNIREIIINNNIEQLRKDILDILGENRDYEVFNVMNELFAATIPNGYVYKVSQIVKTCADIMG